MAYQKLSPVTLIAALQDRVQTATGLKCYDHVPFNAKSPFYFVELVRTQPSNTKTMFRETIRYGRTALQKKVILPFRFMG